MRHRYAIVLCAGLSIAACGGRTRLPLPPPPSALSATAEDAFDDPPDAEPTTDPPTIPSITTRTLANGMQFFFVQRTDIPSTAVVFACRASGHEDRDVVRGIDALEERVLERIGHRSSIALHGHARPDVTIFAGGVEISTSGSSTSLWAMVQMMSTIVRTPAFDDATVVELRHAMFEEIAPSARGPSWMYGIHEREMIFGAHDPRAQDWYGDPAVFGHLGASDVSARHAQLFTPSESAIVVVGDADLERTEELVRRWFDDWQAPAVRGTPLGPAAFPAQSARLHAIPAAGTETMFHVRERAPTTTDPDRPAFEVLTALLGGMFGARMNRIMREERGHTYGVHAQIADHGGSGYALLEIDLSIPSSHIRDTIFTIIDELRRVQDEAQIEPRELASARATAISRYRRWFATRGATATAIANLFVERSDPSVWTTRTTAAEHVTAADVARVARAWVRPEATPILVVGSGTQLRGAIFLVPGGSEFVVWRW